MAPVVERVIESVELGEGPHWDETSQSLYYVDIFGKAIHKYTPSTNHHTKAVLGKHVGFIIPVEGQADQFVVGLGRNFALVTWDGVSQLAAKIEILAEVENRPGVDGNRFNDGKADPAGRLWAGTMGAEPVNGKIDPNKGSLYSLDSEKQVKTHLTGVHISNGLAWSEDKTKFYYIDSGKRCIDQFDYDVINGTIKNCTPIFTLAKHGLTGIPDGQTIDTDGNLWVAIFNGSCVIKIDPRKPETLLQTIAIPAKEVTSVAFGGPNLDQLYVTTAKFTIDEELPPPLHGATYVIKNTGSRGYPAVNVKL